uniref:Uncharacterized protein n=1 Tax=Salix viminalis TaxID=40686 RepID=A0A6N2N259_SALVM
MDVKSVIPGESVTSDESKGRERSEKKLDSGKKKDKWANSESSRERSEHELGDGHKNLKLSRGTKKSIEGERSQKNLESSTSSDKGSLKSKKVNNGKDHNPFPYEMAVKPAVALRAILGGGVAIFAKVAGAMKAAGGVKLGAAAAAATTAAIPGERKD